MNIEQIRARLVEIQKELEGLSASAEGYSEAQIEQVETLNGEFESLSKQLETAEKVEAMKAKVTASAGRKTAAVNPGVAASRVEVGASGTDRFGGFKSGGEFLMAVKDAGTGRKVAEQLQNATSYERIGEDGGFLVPGEIADGILKKLESSESLMAKTTQFSVGGNALTINVDESQPWNQGITAYWTAEGASITSTKNALKQAQFRLQKLAALVNATDELLDDATALESYIKVAAPAAIMHKINDAIISGNGVGKPTGIINSDFAVTVNKETSQTADTINARNVINMYSRMFPGARGNAAWYINAGAEPQLLTLQDDNGNFIYLAPGSQMNQSPYGLLLGRPVYPMMGSMPALGDVGDIAFVDLSYYYMIKKAQGIKSATSIHLYFDKEITSFRFSMRVDGKMPFTAPVTTEYGSYQMSAAVLLQAR